MAHQNLQLTFDYRSIVSQHVVAIRAEMESQHKAILREAFDAGHQKGERTAAYGHDNYGYFEEWLEDFIRDSEQV